MPNDEISDIASDIVQNPAVASSVTGRLAADTKPGMWVVFTSGTWTKADNDTSAHKLLKAGVARYRERINDDAGFPTIDEVVDIDNEPFTDNWSICTDGIVAAFCTSQAAITYPLTPFIISSTAGSVTSLVQAATGATSGTALRQVVVGTLARKIESSSTVGFFGIGRFVNEVY